MFCRIFFLKSVDYCNCFWFFIEFDGKWLNIKLVGCINDDMILIIFSLENGFRIFLYMGM